MKAKKHPNIANIGLLCLLTTALLIAYLPALKSLLIFWWVNDNYSHGFFILPFSIYLVLKNRNALAAIPANPSLWGLVLVIASLLIYILAHYAEIATVAYVSMISLLSGVVIYIWGFRMFKEVLFPLFFMVFMVPVPDQIYSSFTGPLQLLVSEVSTVVAGLLNIPIYREGNILNLPNHSFQVVEACSGLRSMMSLLMLSTLIGYFFLKCWIPKAILILAAIPTAIFVNFLRVLLMITTFYYFNIDIVSGSIHTALGIAIFIISLIILMRLKSVLERLESTP